MEKKTRYLYHGSRSKFDKINIAKTVEIQKARGIISGYEPSMGDGFYLTDDFHDASGFGRNGYIYRVEVSDELLERLKKERFKFGNQYLVESQEIADILNCTLRRMPFQTAVLAWVEGNF